MNGTHFVNDQLERMFDGHNRTARRRFKRLISHWPLTPPRPVRHPRLTLFVERYEAAIAPDPCYCSGVTPLQEQSDAIALVAKQLEPEEKTFIDIRAGRGFNICARPKRPVSRRQRGDRLPGSKPCSATRGHSGRSGERHRDIRDQVSRFYGSLPAVGMWRRWSGMYRS